MISPMPPRTWHPSEFPVEYGRYTLLHRIAFGGMAEIFLARLCGAAAFEKTVVVKRLLPHLATDSMVELLLSEAKVHATIDHRNVVQVYELQQAQTGEFYLVMEHVDGPDLGVLMRQACELDCRIPVWFSLWVVCETLSALAHVHHMRDEDGEPLQIIHRDISPSNLFVSHAGDLKLGDFGVVKSAIQVHLTESGIIKGKLEYAAPEHVLGEPFDHRLDLFSLGVVFWELLTQERLFTAESQWDVMQRIIEGERRPPSLIRSDVPKQLDPIVRKCLEVKREARYANAEEVLAQVQPILAKLKPVLLPSDITKVINTLLDRPGDKMQLPSLTIPPPAPNVGTLSSLQRRNSSGASGFRGWEDETHSSGVDGFVEDATIAEPTAKRKDIKEEIWVELSSFSVDTLPEDALNSDEFILPTNTTPPPEALGPGLIIDDLAIDTLQLDTLEERVHKGIVAPDASEPGNQSGLKMRFKSGDVVNLSCMDELVARVMELNDPQDGSVWLESHAPLTAQRFTQLSDLDGRWMERPTQTATLMGDFSERSLSATLSDFAQRELTGVMHAQFAKEHLELYLIRGALAHARSDQRAQQLPPLLRSSGLLDQGRLDEALKRVLQTGRPLVEVSAELLTIDENQIRAFAMSERLGRHIASSSGRYLFVTEAEPKTPRPTEVVGPFLLKTALRVLDLEQLKQLLGPVAQQSLRFSRRFIEQNRAYYLSLPQRRAIHLLANGARLSELTREPPEHQCAQLAMVYIFLETGQLVQSESS